MTNRTTERFVSVKKLLATEDSFAPNANAANQEIFLISEIRIKRKRIILRKMSHCLMVINLLDNFIPEKIRVIPKAKKSG